jgi:S1-C subfamily serine protease
MIIFTEPLRPSNALIPSIRFHDLRVCVTPCRIGQRAPALAIIALLSLASAVSHAQQSVRQIAERALPSVVMLVLHDQNGQPRSLGSGFIVGDGLVVTNLHVVGKATSGIGKIVGKAESFNLGGFLFVDVPHDLVLQYFDGLKAPSLQLADSKTTFLGDEVLAVGTRRGWKERSLMEW